MTLSYDAAVALDHDDPLARFRAEFLPSGDLVAYLDGNSLGRPPARTVERVEDVLRRGWGERLIRSWEDGWLDLPEQAGDRLAAACLGAAPGQTVIAESTSVNLFKVLHAGCGMRPGRDEIVATASDFPTDRYLVESVAAARGMTLRWLRPDVVEGVTADELRAVLSERTAVVLLSHVDYRSGVLLDLPAVTALVHEVGALAVWDLCHSVGVVPVALDDSGVDLAVGCTYKYLNAGPGAPAFLYVAQRHVGTARQPITGWWSSADRFAMGPAYEADPSIRAMLSGTADVLGIVAVDASASLVAEAGITAIREKSVALTEVCVTLADAWLAPCGFVVASPRDPARRGSHVTVQGPRAREVAEAMYAAEVIADFRNPDMIRLGLSPLTTSYAELWAAMDVTRGIVEAL